MTASIPLMVAYRWITCSALPHAVPWSMTTFPLRRDPGSMAFAPARAACSARSAARSCALTALPTSTSRLARTSTVIAKKITKIVSEPRSAGHRAARSAGHRGPRPAARPEPRRASGRPRRPWRRPWPRRRPRRAPRPPGRPAPGTASARAAAGLAARIPPSWIRAGGTAPPAAGPPPARAPFATAPPEGPRCAALVLALLASVQVRPEAVDRTTGGGVNGQVEPEHDGGRLAGHRYPHLAGQGVAGDRVDVRPEHPGAEALVVVLRLPLGQPLPARPWRILAGHPRAELGGRERHLPALVVKRVLDGQPDQREQHRCQDRQLDGARPAVPLPAHGRPAAGPGRPACARAGHQGIWPLLVFIWAVRLLTIFVTTISTAAASPTTIAVMIASSIADAPRSRWLLAARNLATLLPKSARAYS